MRRHAQLLYLPLLSLTLRFTTLKDADATAPQTALTRDARIVVCRVPRNLEILVALHQNRLGDGLICDPNPNPTLNSILSVYIYIYIQ